MNLSLVSIIDKRLVNQAFNLKNNQSSGLNFLKYFASYMLIFSDFAFFKIAERKVCREFC